MKGNKHRFCIQSNGL